MRFSSDAAHGAPAAREKEWQEHASFYERYFYGGASFNLVTLRSKKKKEKKTFSNNELIYIVS